MRAKIIIFNCLMSFFLPITAMSASTNVEPSNHGAVDGVVCSHGICQVAETHEQPGFFFTVKQAGADVLVFIWQRFPNVQEMFIDVASQAPLDVALGGFTKQLGNNPAAKSFLRDSLKLPATFLKAWREVPIGSTGLVFDVSNVYSQVAKVATKVGGIYVFTSLGMNPEVAGTTANYIGDPLAKLFIKAGKDRQTEHKTDLPFYEYLVTNFQLTRGMMSIVLEVGPKVLIVNSLGALISRSGITPYIKGMRIFAVPAGAGKVRRFAYAVAGTFAATWAVTYMLAPAARIVQDGMSLVTDDYAYPWVLSWWNQPSSEKAEEGNTEEL